MKTHTIKAGSKIVGQLYTFIDAHQTADTGNVLDNISREIPYIADIGYAGFKTRNDMQKHITWAIFGTSLKRVKARSFRPEVEKTGIKLIGQTFLKCWKTAPSTKTVKIFLFPTFDPFVKKNMLGASGLCMWKNAITLYIHPETKVWKKSLVNSVCHEYAHSTTNNYNTWKTILDGIIFEGLAEHFRDAVVGGGPSLWSTSISEKRAKALMKKLKNKLASTDGVLYKEIFYGGSKYPKWSGYSIGYHIVRNYLRLQKNVNWKEILRKNPKEILKASKFLD